jgi:iron complex transport system substrate-binding protein
MENLLELQPDIVFADTMLTYNPDAQTQLKNAGIPVVIELMNNATCLKTCIHDLGVILGKEENAAAMTNYITSYETLVNERLANITAAEKPKVYIEWGTWQSYAEGSGADGNIVAAGGLNVASGSSTSYPTVSPESIVEKDPDVILLLQFGTAPNMTSFKSTVDGLYSREVLSGTTAIKEKRVYAYSPDIFEGIRYPVGLLYFAKWFYPAQFADIDPATVHQDLIEKFFDLPLDGVFTYPETLTIVDGTDTTLTLNLPVNRIVSLNSGMTEILCALGCEDQLVGRDESSTLPPSVLKVPTAGESSYYPNLEVLLELEPDLVVADSSFTYVPEGMSRLQAAGIPVFISDTSDPQASAHSNSTTIDFTCNLVYKLSMIVQKQDRANDYITYAQHYNNLVKERIANLTKDQRPNVMLEWYAPYNTFVTPSLDQAGGINIAENQSIYAPVLSPEFVVEQNPSVIIRLILSLNHDEVDFKAAQTEILNRPELSGVAAIKNDGVFICDYAIRDGIHGLVGYLYWAKWCQPDLFADINPAAVSAEIDQTFFGETISGVFAYP